MIIVGSVFLAVGLILGTVFVLIGTQDYSAFTARASATVVNVDVTTRRTSQGRTTTSRDYDVQFIVDGQRVRINNIGGIHSGDYNSGDSVAVIFPPGQPERAVWASTVDGGQQILLYVGLGIGVLLGGLGAVIVILGLRRRSEVVQPVDDGVGVSGVVMADPGAADEIGRPWTFDEIVGGLVRATTGTPYTVDRSSNSATVRINLVDTSWWALFQRQGLTRSYATTITPVAPTKVARSDNAREFDWAAGPDGRLAPVLNGRTSTSAGRVWSVGSEQIWALGPAGVEKVVDYRLDSAELQALIAAILRRAGWSTVLDTQSRIGLWVALVALVGAAITVVVLLF